MHPQGVYREAAAPQVKPTMSQALLQGFLYCRHLSEPGSVVAVLVSQTQRRQVSFISHTAIRKGVGS